jgi:hypothetical protein
MKVSYIHRTVKDYLDGVGIRHILSKRTGGVSAKAFNPHVALIKAYILQLKSLKPKDDRKHGASALAQEAQMIVDSVITYIRRAEGDLCEPQIRLMDAFVESANSWWKSTKGGNMLPEGESDITLAVQCGSSQFLHAKLDAKTLKMPHSRPLLDYAINPTAAFEPFVPRSFVSVSKPTVIVLLEYGTDPNEGTAEKPTP